MADERLIVALDFHTMNDVKKLVEDLGDAVNFYKVGMELFYSVGAGVVEWLKSRDKKVFLLDEEAYTEYEVNNFTEDDLESIVTIWKALGMYKKIIKKRHEKRPSEQQNQLTLRPQIDTLKTW